MSTPTSADPSPAPANHLPLSGIRVVDLTRVMTGPYATMMLADMGADVIKIEMPGKGDDTRAWGPPFQHGVSTYYLSVNRNKRSVALDLKSDTGKSALWTLIEGADVVVENFTPGTIDRLGFGYEAVRARNPNVIFASISGFGQSGPAASRTAYDLIVQGMSGMMSITGAPGSPPTKLGIPIADITAGMFAAFAIATALYDRERTAEGRYIDVSMLGGQVALLTYQAGIYFATGQTPGQLGNAHPIVAPYDAFRVSDGYVNVAAGNDSLWQRLCAAFGMEDAAQDERFATNADRITNKEALYAAIDAVLGDLTVAEVTERLDACGVPCGPIYSISQLFEDPQFFECELAQDIEHPTIGDLRLPGLPYRLSGVDLSVRTPPPALGQHTREVLREAGVSDEEIDALA
ncbi:MAG: CaiB/BaiF CoA transferase family protein [Thermomicrobiales bacterium]